MALVKYGAGIIQMSGSIAGNTFARNAYGNYVRSRTKGVNPNSAMQQSIRNAMAQLTARWSSTLTAAQRSAWNTYAEALNWLNRLGEEIALTGFNHYIRSNLARLYAGLEIVDDGPATLALPDADAEFDVAYSEASGEVTVTFDDERAWCDVTGAGLSVFIGSPVNETRNYFDGPWKFAGLIAGDDSTAPTSGATITVPWSFAEDHKMFAYGRILKGDGRVSSPFRASATAAA